MAKKSGDSKFDKALQLTWKKLWIIIISAFLLVILHNAVYAIWNFEEGIFFILFFLVILYFIIALIYSLVKFIFNKLK